MATVLLRSSAENFTHQGGLTVPVVTRSYLVMRPFWRVTATDLNAL